MKIKTTVYLETNIPDNEINAEKVLHEQETDFEGAKENFVMCMNDNGWDIVSILAYDVKLDSQLVEE